VSKQKKTCPCGSGKKYRDCCYARDQAKSAPAPSFLSSVWIPSLALCAVPLYVVSVSMADHDYAHRAFWIQNDALNGLSMACFVLAGLLALLPPFQRAAVRHLEKLSQAPMKEHLKWLSLCFLAIGVWFGFIRFCEYRAFLLPTDTAIFVQSAHMFLRYGRHEYPALGMNILSQHFDWVSALFSPVLLLWDHPLALLMAHNLFASVIPVAAYVLAFSLTSSTLAGFVGLLLTLSAPSLYELLTANPDVLPLVAFFLGAMIFLRARRWIAAFLCLLLMAACKEQVPFIYLGLGLYSVYALRARKPWNWVVGGIACAAALGLWRAEMSIIDHYQRFELDKSFAGEGKWVMFAHLAPKGTPLADVPAEIARHPLLIVRFLTSSLYVYYPLLRVLFSMGFLCLLAPLQMIPFAAAFWPHLLANPGDRVNFFDYHPITYFDFGLHQSSYILGPLIWATAHGIGRAHEKLSRLKSEGWLLVWSLVVAGVGFKYAHRTLNPTWRAPWFDAMPRVQAQIPPHARLWVDEYAAAPVSDRRWVKFIMWGPGLPAGYKALFKPDYVLFDKGFVVYGKPPYRDQMLTFFALNKYVKVADDHNIVLLRSPNPAPDPEGDADAVELPAADPALVNVYGHYLLGS
jgi:hypothetical protein